MELTLHEVFLLPKKHAYGVNINLNLNKAQEVAKGGDVHYLLDSKVVL